MEAYDWMTTRPNLARRSSSERKAASALADMDSRYDLAWSGDTAHAGAAADATNHTSMTATAVLSLIEYPGASDRRDES